ncbi:lysine-rich nucleolar protein 1 [Periophthalmus magnuspinnatus]|uniref:lysine-rich nucleolar protein 1 n=1 Tax=Periophthalmus magnuspinnatus TaxID=409849 RepID=UPI00145A1E7F|nr:lysine-rich nucleolar protein 1 [Periophthalmus magnuspinnatus]
MKMNSKEGAPKKDMIKKVKKQKKNDIPEVKMENIVKTEEMLVEASDNNEIKKNKKKRKLTTEPTNVIDDAHVGEVIKKKKTEHTDSADNLQEGPVKERKKKIKNKSMQTESNIEIVKMEDVEDNCALQDVKKTSKEHNKVKHKIVTNTKKTEKKDKKKKTKQLTEEDISNIKTIKAKKSKKDKPKVEENDIKTPESGHIENGKTKKKKVSISVAKELEGTESSQVKKKKHKKTKSENEMDTVVDTKKYKMPQDNFNLTESPKPKKKKKKKPEESDKEPLLGKVEATSKSKLKKRSKKVESKDDIEADAGTKKKKKIKQEQEEYPQAEVVFLSEKAGNTDEVNVNKERRKALQMEIDQASQPKKPVKPLGLGQWSTAEFGSSEQQQKFLRLMGGFKKGFQPASVNGGGGNMALGRDAQQQLQQGLLGEFERAHSRRMDSSNKGAGLGFTAPSTKKFSIDANATRSIRFDD